MIQAIITVNFPESCDIQNELDMPKKVLGLIEDYGLQEKNIEAIVMLDMDEEGDADIEILYPEIPIQPIDRRIFDYTEAIETFVYDKKRYERSLVEIVLSDEQWILLDYFNADHPNVVMYDPEGSEEGKIRIFPDKRSAEEYAEEELQMGSWKAVQI